jgi:hypothetical protein
MTRLRACYQNFPGDDTRWTATVAVYWEKLSVFADEDLRKAFAGADEQFPDWFPNRAQLVQWVKAFEKSHIAKADHQLGEGEAFADNEGARRAREIVASVTAKCGLDE